MTKQTLISKLNLNTIANPDIVNANFNAVGVSPLLGMSDAANPVALNNFVIGSETAIANGSLLETMKVRSGGSLNVYNAAGALLSSVDWDDLGGLDDGYFDNYLLSWANSTSLTMAIGVCKSFDNTEDIRSTSIIEKTTEKWAEGSGAIGSFLGYGNIALEGNASPGSSDESNSIDKNLSTKAVLGLDTTIVWIKYDGELKTGDKVYIKFDATNLTDIFLTEQGTSTKISDTLDLTAINGVQTLALTLTDDTSAGYKLEGTASGSVDLFEVIPLWYDVAYVDTFGLNELYPFIIRKTDGTVDLLLTNVESAIALILPFTPSVEGTYENYRQNYPALSYTVAGLTTWTVKGMVMVSDGKGRAIPSGVVKRELITSSSTVIKPDGASFVFITAYGGGGGGSKVGSGGTASVDGGDTTVDIAGHIITAGGGKKGANISNLPGAGGTATLGYINNSGGAGGDGDDGLASTGGSGGTNRVGLTDGTATPGDFLYGTGGAGGPNSQPGSDATNYASGGGGGDASASGGGGGGGAMAIYWALAENLDIVIGAGGSGGTPNQEGGDGSQGIVEIIWS